MKITAISQLLSVNISWRRVEGALWEATVENEECFLAMNDFPDEPLYTLKWRDQYQDLDDAPKCWSIPHNH